MKVLKVNPLSEIYLFLSEFSSSNTYLDFNRVKKLIHIIHFVHHAAVIITNTVKKYALRKSYTDEGEAS